MAKARMSIDFSAFDEYKKMLDEIGGDATKRAIDGALKASQQKVANNLEKAMAKHTHYSTGKTKESIIDRLPVEWTGDAAEIAVGFKISDGGLPSIFLMYGTKLYGQPHITPDRNLYNAVYGTATKKEVRAEQEKAFLKVLERVRMK